MSNEKYIEEIKEVWEEVKRSFRENLSESTVNLWFNDIQVLSFADDIITLGINSQFKFEKIQNYYIDSIKEKFCSIFGFSVGVNLIFTGSATADDEVRSSVSFLNEKKSEKKELLSKNLPNYNFEYTFENFIVGSTNKFAHAACVAVANNPATNYNPLFIYGNSGLGKTHLLYATINHMKKKNPRINIIYTKGEDFTNQMIACLTSKTMEDFRDKYRTCDVLLIDDIQFIAGKISTQEEFFHTFNALYEEKKQIILTSDRPPRDIKTLEDRLKSRFEWGLIADIEPPDLELRIAIIKKKAEQVSVAIPDEVLTFLGENLRSNIRQIEGAIKKLAAFSFLQGKTITMDLAKECIAELLEGAEPVSVTVEKVFTAVFNKYHIQKEVLIGPKRNKDIAQARHIAVYLIRELTEMSYPSIAKIFNRDHASVMASYNNVYQKVQFDSVFVVDINELKKEIIG